MEVAIADGKTTYDYQYIFEFSDGSVWQNELPADVANWNVWTKLVPDDSYNQPVRVVGEPDLVNRKMTVSGGQWDPTGSSGLDRVTFMTQGGKGTIAAVNDSANTITVNDPGVRDKRWIADNEASIDFFVAGPSVVDTPLLTSNVWLESSPFSTTPPTNPDGSALDALTKITWSITPDGGGEMIQDAGTSNPYQPTGLELDTWHTIKVKHEGLKLGESIGPWSNTARFKTGLSRSLKEHYVKQIKGLEQQLAAAQGTKTRSVERKRARNADGTYRGDDPSTPDVNEAWEDG